MDIIKAFTDKFGAVPENTLNNHANENQAWLFSGIDSQSSELEVLNFLYSLVVLDKASRILDLGTGNGYSAAALAAGCRTNGVGSVISVDNESGNDVAAVQNLVSLSPDLVELVQFETADSVEFLKSFSGEKFDLVFLDTDPQNFVAESTLLRMRGLVRSGGLVVLHGVVEIPGYAVLRFPLSRGLTVLQNSPVNPF